MGHRGCASLFSKIMTETASENFLKHWFILKLSRCEISKDFWCFHCLVFTQKIETPIQPNVLLEDGFGCHSMYHITSCVTPAVAMAL